MSIVDQITVLGALMRFGKRRRFADRTALESWQHEQVVGHLNRLLPRSAALRRRFGNLPVERWQELPVTNKSAMMAEFDELLTVPVKKEEAFAAALQAEQRRGRAQIGNLTVGLSSGTSGTRGLFVVSARERALWAGAVLGRCLRYRLGRPERIALLLRANSTLYESVSSRSVRFAYIDLLQPPEMQLAALARFDPTVIAGPPSALAVLARLGGASALTPAALFAVAEMLDPEDKARIERTWRPPLGQIYQATEGFIGVALGDGPIICNDDLMVIQKEWVDRTLGLFTPILTDFTRTAQPIIRYRLDDVLALDDSRADAAYTTLTSVQGRCDDLLYLSDQQGKSRPVTPDLLSRAMMAASDKFIDYQITQDSPQHLIVSVQWERSLCADEIASVQGSIRDSIREWTSRACLASPAIGFAPWAFQRNPGNKVRRIIRSFTPPEHT